MVHTYEKRRIAKLEAALGTSHNSRFHLLSDEQRQRFDSHIATMKTLAEIITPADAWHWYLDNSLDQDILDVLAGPERILPSDTSAAALEKYQAVIR